MHFMPIHINHLSGWNQKTFLAFQHDSVPYECKQQKDCGHSKNDQENFANYMLFLFTCHFLHLYNLPVHVLTTVRRMKFNFVTNRNAADYMLHYSIRTRSTPGSYNSVNSLLRHLFNCCISSSSDSRDRSRPFCLRASE